MDKSKDITYPKMHLKKSEYLLYLRYLQFTEYYFSFKMKFCKYCKESVKKISYFDQ